MSHDSPVDPLTNTLRPLTDAVLTIRVIKSFEYRTTKNVILHHVDLTSLTVGALKELVQKGPSRPRAGFPRCSRTGC